MITRDEFRQIAANGVWNKNTSIVQILGLCPLLAVTTNLVNGGSLGDHHRHGDVQPGLPSPACAT